MLQNRLAQLREERANGDTGFTLIELLVVVVIIGILIAIAIPLYLNYENGAKDKGAESDVHSTMLAVQQCYDNNGDWPASTTGDDTAPVAICTGEDVNLSKNDSLTYTAPVSGSSDYTIAVTNSDTGTTYTYTSSDGQIVKS